MQTATKHRTGSQYVFDLIFDGRANDKVTHIIDHEVVQQRIHAALTALVESGALADAISPLGVKIEMGTVQFETDYPVPDDQVPMPA